MSEKEFVFKSELTLNPDKKLAYGWFNVMTKEGKLLEDKQGDMIEPETMAEAARAFISDSREGKYRHDGPQVATVVESLVLTKEVQEILGINLDMEGWFGALQFHDEKAWEDVKKGETLGLSIGGISHFREVNTE